MIAVLKHKSRQLSFELRNKQRFAIYDLLAYMAENMQSGDMVRPALLTAVM